MKEIIENLIKIDTIAQKTLNNANSLKDNVDTEIQTEKIKIAKNIAEKSQIRIENIKEKRQNEISAAKKEIDKNSESIINKLEQTYQASHKSIEKQIFDNIITS